MDIIFCISTKNSLFLNLQVSSINIKSYDNDIDINWSYLVLINSYYRQLIYFTLKPI